MFPIRNDSVKIRIDFLLYLGTENFSFTICSIKLFVRKLSLSL